MGSGLTVQSKLSPPLCMQPNFLLARITWLIRRLHKVLPTASAMPTLRAGASLTVSSSVRTSPTLAGHCMAATLVYSIRGMTESCCDHGQSPMCLFSADWSKWQKVTLQYLDTNNKIVSTQVAVPSECDHVKHCCACTCGRHLMALDCCTL